MIAVFAGLGLSSRSALASMTVDLRVVSTTSGTVLDAKHVLFTGGPGDSVRMNVWATVVGDNPNPNDDLILSLHGSFLSMSTGLHGNLSAFNVNPYNGILAYPGEQQDLNGDGDIDVGSNDDSTLANFFRAYHRGDEPYEAQAIVGIVFWTYTSGVGETSVSFRPRNVDDGAAWIQDGLGETPTTGAYLTGESVNIAFLPEPSRIAVIVGAISQIYQRLRWARSTQRRR